MVQNLHGNLPFKFKKFDYTSSGEEIVNNYGFHQRRFYNPGYVNTSNFVGRLRRFDFNRSNLLVKAFYVVTEFDAEYVIPGLPDIPYYSCPWDFDPWLPVDPSSQLSGCKANDDFQYRINYLNQESSEFTDFVVPFCLEPDYSQLNDNEITRVSDSRTNAGSRKVFEFRFTTLGGGILTIFMNTYAQMPLQSYELISISDIRWTSYNRQLTAKFTYIDHRNDRNFSVNFSSSVREYPEITGWTYKTSLSDQYNLITDNANTNNVQLPPITIRSYRRYPSDYSETGGLLNTFDSCGNVTISTSPDQFSWGVHTLLIKYPKYEANFDKTQLITPIEYLRIKEFKFIEYKTFNFKFYGFGDDTFTFKKTKIIINSFDPVKPLMDQWESEEAYKYYLQMLEILRDNNSNLLNGQSVFYEFMISSEKDKTNVMPIPSGLLIPEELITYEPTIIKHGFTYSNGLNFDDEYNNVKSNPNIEYLNSKDKLLKEN